MLSMRKLGRHTVLLALVALGAVGCGGGTSLPPVPLDTSGVIDQAASTCSVTVDGFISYQVPVGTFAPIDTNHRSSCGASLVPTPPIPSWAKPTGTTQTVFVATSLQEVYSLAGMQSIEAAAAPHHVPVTWMIGGASYLTNASLYTNYHVVNGDDVEAEPDASLIGAMQTLFPWYAPVVSADGAGRERNVATDLSSGETGFWGITWNSHNTDHTYDMGAPWGTYCADPTSYKRPEPDGGCVVLAFEWTARDLTRAYLSDTDGYSFTAEAAFSTDPEDLQQRGGFSTSAAEQYVQQMVDVYAAAGQSQPLVMMSQQESAEDTNAGDAQILASMYAQAIADGMKVETLAQANATMRTASAAPRAIAFPFIAGGTSFPSMVDGGRVFPATIDFHDTRIGLTFLAGHTLPTRAFRYSDDPTSAYNVPLTALSPTQFPQLQGVNVRNGALLFTIQAPVALHFGFALWSDPSSLGLNGTNVVPAGHAGAVIVVDLQPGVNQLAVPCARCVTTTLPYST
jgi:hypothetical protein